MPELYREEESIERLLNIENREKKQIGRNVFKRKATRKGGAKGKLLTAIDFMTKEERRKYIKPSEVSVYKMEMEREHVEMEPNIIADFGGKPPIPTLDVLLSMEKANHEEAKQLYFELKNSYKNKILRKGLGDISYHSLRKLDLLFGTPNPRPSYMTETVVDINEAIDPVNVPVEEPKVNTGSATPSDLSGLFVRLNGRYTKEDAENKLLSILSLLDGDGAFEVHFTIAEV